MNHVSEEVAMKPSKTISSVAGLTLLSMTAALAQLAGPPDLDLSWNTIDGGGATFSTGSQFELGGTIGQPDAGGPMTGGGFSLSGGFWPGAGPEINTCLADIAPPRGDGLVNTADLLLVINSWGACPGCPADIAPAGPPQGDDLVNTADLLTVINNWGLCP
jgi:hypothetical protein